MSEPIIALKGVKKSYGKHQVLTGVDLTVNRGDIYGLVGRNGAGKTTIFKIILGLSEYNAGTLAIGEGSDDKHIREGRSRIGFLVGNNSFPNLTARENLRYYAALKGIRDRGEVDRVLKLVELEGVKQKAGNFSLGMKQRLGIANALLGSPDILILDEPTNGLDPQGIADVRRLIQRLNRELGITVVVSSHILGELQNTATRFGIVHGGTVVREITAEGLESEEKLVTVSVDDLERAQAALEAAGVRVLRTANQGRSLEDFYFDLVGGSGNE